MIHKIVGYWADWPALFGNGDIGTKRAGGPRYEDTKIPGNMIEPCSTGKYYKCPVCGRNYEISSCIFQDSGFLPHFHDQQEIEVEYYDETKIIKLSEIKKFNQFMDEAMVNVIENGMSPLIVFSVR